MITELRMDGFTPIAGLLGGILIGLASALYMLAIGRIAGISGMLEGFLRPTTPGFALAAAFLIGMPIGALVTVILFPMALAPVDIRGGALFVAIAGLLVGFGTRLANGCTSGHGVCGLPRLSRRSLIATAVFMVSAMVTVFFVRYVI
jgi:uncharacterized membrane protein YedE/YeeE